MRVYLAGPIEGCTKDESMSWRKRVGCRLAAQGIESYIPDDAGGPSGYTEQAFKHAVFHKDIYQIDRADVVLANVSKLSFGTPFELGYAYARNKLIVVVAPKEMHFHPFLTLPAVYFSEMEEAIGFIIKESY